MISVSIASVLGRSPGTGSGQGLQLTVFPPIPNEAPPAGRDCIRGPGGANVPFLQRHHSWIEENGEAWSRVRWRCEQPRRQQKLAEFFVEGGCVWLDASLIKPLVRRIRIGVEHGIIGPALARPKSRRGNLVAVSLARHRVWETGNAAGVKRGRDGQRSARPLNQMTPRKDGLGTPCQ